MTDIDDLHVVALTGHRPNKLGGYDKRNPTARRVLNSGVEVLSSVVESCDKKVVVLSGLALGWDQWMANECVTLGIPFVGVAPCRGQDERWPDQSRRAYAQLCEAADDDCAMVLNTRAPDGPLARSGGVLYVYDGPYLGPWVMTDRNEWMVDNCAEVLACHDGSGGGTANCIKYAKSKRKKITTIDPRHGGWTITEPVVQGSLWD